MERVKNLVRKYLEVIDHVKKTRNIREANWIDSTALIKIQFSRIRKWLKKDGKWKKYKICSQAFLVHKNPMMNTCNLKKSYFDWMIKKMNSGLQFLRQQLMQKTYRCAQSSKKNLKD